MSGPLILGAPIRIGFLVSILSLVGCQFDVGIPGKILDSNPDNPPSSEITSDWILIDLSTGQVSQRAQIDDLASNVAYRTSHLVFRRINILSTPIGAQAHESWGGSDPVQRTVAIQPFYIGVFELTRGQWLHLSSTTPWSYVIPASLVGTAYDERLPACGIDYDQVKSTCEAWPWLGSLAIPTAIQWEAACRGGSNTLFSWGSQVDDATVRRFAVVDRRIAGSEGPHPVGTLEPNAFGMYDMHGNVWEWIQDGVLRGGSWHDDLAVARSSNSLSVDRSMAHALVGVRLIYVP